MENYGLDPAHYLTSPGLAWDAMLKMTKISLELITDIDVQLFIEKGMRGGISYIHFVSIGLDNTTATLVFKGISDCIANLCYVFVDLSHSI